MSATYFELPTFDGYWFEWDGSRWIVVHGVHQTNGKWFDEYGYSCEPGKWLPVVFPKEPDR